MNKPKSSISQTKSKPKNIATSPITVKSPCKLKEKITKLSPRANRIHTLENKKSIQITKKCRLALENISSESNYACSSQSKKGYQTPKFKQEQSSHMRRKEGAAHNFFSFGDSESPNFVERKQIPGKQNNNNGKISKDLKSKGCRI